MIKKGAKVKILTGRDKNKEGEVSKLNTGKVIYSTKVIKPSSEELKNHEMYLKTSLKKKLLLIKSF